MAHYHGIKPITQELVPSLVFVFAQFDPEGFRLAAERAAAERRRRYAREAGA